MHLTIIFLTLLSLTYATPPACLLACVAREHRRQSVCPTLNQVSCICKTVSVEIIECLHEICPSDKEKAVQRFQAACAEFGVHEAPNYVVRDEGTTTTYSTEGSTHESTTEYHSPTLMTTTDFPTVTPGPTEHDTVTDGGPTEHDTVTEGEPTATAEHQSSEHTGEPTASATPTADHSSSEHVTGGEPTTSDHFSSSDRVTGEAETTSASSHLSTHTSTTSTSTTLSAVTITTYIETTETLMAATVTPYRVIATTPSTPSTATLPLPPYLRLLFCVIIIIYK